VCTEPRPGTWSACRTASGARKAGSIPTAVAIAGFGTWDTGGDTANRDPTSL